MQVNKVFKLQLEADKDTWLVVDGQSRICNWLYNQLLEKANFFKQQFIDTGNAECSRIVYTKYGLRDLIPKLKKEHPFLKTVHSSPLKNSALRLTQTIQAYQKGKKGKRKNSTGWPSFQAWRAHWFSLYYDEPNKGFKITGDTLELSLGADKNRKRLSVSLQIKDAHLLKGHAIRTLRIVKENGLYFAICAVQGVLPVKKPIKTAIALDPNHKNMVYGVATNGKAIEVEAPRWLQAHDKRTDELKSRRDRCNKKAKKMLAVDSEGQPTGREYYLSSREWEKRNRVLERHLHTSREQKKTYMYTLAHSLCQEYDFIGIGNYAPDGTGVTTSMRRAMNNRSLIAQFKEILSWTCAKSGKTFVEYDEKGTTRTCSRCYYVLPQGLSPSIRNWQCPECKKDHHRDENSAINGLKRILRDLETKKSEMEISQVPCSGLVSVEERWAWRVLPSGVVKRCAGEEQQVRLATPRNEIESAIAFGQKVDHLTSYSQL
jgi:putative transposase